MSEQLTLDILWALSLLQTIYTKYRIFFEKLKRNVRSVTAILTGALSVHIFHYFYCLIFSVPFYFLFCIIYLMLFMLHIKSADGFFFDFFSKNGLDISCEIIFQGDSSLEISSLGPSCSKLTTSLVNDSLKFTSSDTQIC